jgi:hypothetical protein
VFLLYLTHAAAFTFGVLVMALMNAARSPHKQESRNTENTGALDADRRSAGAHAIAPREKGPVSAGDNDTEEVLPVRRKRRR